MEGRGQVEYKDYYKVLGVERGADEKTIKRAYRRLAVRFHPDKNPGDKSAEDRFKEINEAYEVLGDPTKRAKYDQLGASYEAWQRRGAPGGFDWSQWMRGGPGGGPGGGGGGGGGAGGGVGGGGFCFFFCPFFL